MTLLLLPRRQTLPLLLILPVGIPLTRLQNQNTHQHQRKNGITSRHNLQTVLPTQDLILIVGGRGKIRPVLTQRRETETLDDIRDVDSDTAHVEDEGGAVEEHIRFGGAVEFRDEASETEEDDDVEDSGDEWRRGVEEAEVGF